VTRGMISEEVAHGVYQHAVFAFGVGANAAVG
jgi:hypothetical protein